jgi:hypothetical protein
LEYAARANDLQAGTELLARQGMGLNFRWLRAAAPFTRKTIGRSCLLISLSNCIALGERRLALIQSGRVTSIFARLEHGQAAHK